MSVDYSATVAYGITLDTLPDFISTDRWIDEDVVNDWLKRKGYKHIKYDKGGDFMNGECVHLFYLAGTRRRVDWQTDTLVSFNTPLLTAQQTMEFNRLVNQLDSPATLAWKLVFNVS